MTVDADAAGCRRPGKCADRRAPRRRRLGARRPGSRTARAHHRRGAQRRCRRARRASSIACSQPNVPWATASIRSPHSTRLPATSSHTTAAHRPTVSASISQRSYLVAPTAQSNVRSPTAEAGNSGVLLAVTVTTTSAPSTASVADVGEHCRDAAAAPGRRAIRRPAGCAPLTAIRSSLRQLRGEHLEVCPRLTPRPDQRRRDGVAALPVPGSPAPIPPACAGG